MVRLPKMAPPIPLTRFYSLPDWCLIKSSFVSIPQV